MDRETFLKPRLPEATLDVDGVGEIRVRGLSRIEAIAMRDVKGVEAIEVQTLALGMVDPVLSEEDIRTWRQNASSGELEVITNKILELSGLLEKARTAAERRFHAGAGGEGGVPPGIAAEDDGEGTPGADE